MGKPGPRVYVHPEGLPFGPLVRLGLPSRVLLLVPRGCVIGQAPLPRSCRHRKAPPASTVLAGGWGPRISSCTGHGPRLVTKSVHGARLRAVGHGLCPGTWDLGRPARGTPSCSPFGDGGHRSSAPRTRAVTGSPLPSEF